MWAASAKPGGVGGVSQSVGRDFAKADPGGKLSEKVKGYARGGTVMAPKGLRLGGQAGYSGGGDVTRKPASARLYKNSGLKGYAKGGEVDKTADIVDLEEPTSAGDARKRAEAAGGKSIVDRIAGAVSGPLKEFKKRLTMSGPELDERRSGTKKDADAPAKTQAAAEATGPDKGAYERRMDTTDKSVRDRMAKEGNDDRVARAAAAGADTEKKAGGADEAYSRTSSAEQDERAQETNKEPADRKDPRDPGPETAPAAAAADDGRATRASAMSAAAGAAAAKTQAAAEATMPKPAAKPAPKPAAKASPPAAKADETPAPAARTSGADDTDKFKTPGDIGGAVPPVPAPTARMSGDIGGHARGGRIDKVAGKPIGKDDGLIPAQVGEFVVRKSAVHKLGLAALREINRGRIPASERLYGKHKGVHRG